MAVRETLHPARGVQETEREWMVSDPWLFACVGHYPELVMDYDDGGWREELEKLWANRDGLLALDSDLWPQVNYRAIYWLSRHPHCPVILRGPNGERIPLQPPAAPLNTLTADDLNSRRGIIWLSGERLLHLVDPAEQGYRVRSVFADPQREAVAVVVVHPDLPVIAPGARCTDLEGAVVPEFRVIDGEAWVRHRLVAELPSPASL